MDCWPSIRGKLLDWTPLCGFVLDVKENMVYKYSHKNALNARRQENSEVNTNRKRNDVEKREIKWRILERVVSSPGCCTFCRYCCNNGRAQCSPNYGRPSQNMSSTMFHHVSTSPSRILITPAIYVPGLCWKVGRARVSFHIRSEEEGTSNVALSSNRMVEWDREKTHGITRETCSLANGRNTGTTHEQKWEAKLEGAAAESSRHRVTANSGAAVFWVIVNRRSADFQFLWVDCWTSEMEGTARDPPYRVRAWTLPLGVFFSCVLVF